MQVYADSTIIAISQGPKDKIVSTTSNLQVNDRGLIVIDDDGRTSREGVFASGDVVAGSKNVVLAVKYSKQVAKAMDEYLTKLRGSRHQRHCGSMSSLAKKNRSV